MSQSGSVSEWIEELKMGDASAATHLWNRYHPNLLRFARRLVRGELRRVTDEEDLVAAAFESFFCRLAAGQFSRLAGREELWALLVTITDRKAVNSVRRFLASKRGGGKVLGESTFECDEDEDADSILACTSHRLPGPDVAVRMSEMIGTLEEDMRQVICLRLDGYSNEEIGQRMNRSVATIERRLRLLRAHWLKELFG
jgi:RNA polymerase sigma factor (sigma-70 family)